MEILGCPFKKGALSDTFRIQESNAVDNNNKVLKRILITLPQIHHDARPPSHLVTGHNPTSTKTFRR